MEAISAKLKTTSVIPAYVQTKLQKRPATPPAMSPSVEATSRTWRSVKIKNLDMICLGL
jgi:hypothetical protein